MAQFPTDYRYTKEHEWAARDGDLVKVGVTSYAVEQLGDVTLVDLPEVGTEVQAHERFGDIESVKTVSELFAPVSGEVIEVNQPLVDDLAKLTDDPQGEGWLIRVKMSNPAELEQLMDRSAYEKHCETEAH